jgi:hypothetical protein
LVHLIEQQQQQQQRRQRGPQGLAALTAAALAGTAPAAATNTVQPHNVIMALWAAAAAGVTPPSNLRMLPVFAYLAQQGIVNQLVGSSSSTSTSTSSSSSSEDPQQDQPTPSEETVRTCGTVLWAASQTGFTGDMERLKPYAAAFLAAAQAMPVACGSILTVLLSLASLLSEQQQQQHAVDFQYWHSCLVQTTQALISSLQQQQQDASPAAGQSVAAAVTSQLLWAFEVTGVTLPEEQQQALLELTGDQVRTLVQHTCTATVLL